jgi:hypothetical protein
MNKLFKSENGITLVAMILVAVAMLVLAGVSVKAIIIENDNEITVSQNDDIKIGIELLENYLEQQYEENCDVTYDDKLTAMLNESNLNQYFQKNLEGEYYFLNPTTNTKYYFIEKSALPQNIQDYLVGGNLSLTGKTIYAEFNDIYGITSDLKVFYCENGYDSMIKLDSQATILNIET